MALIFLSEIIFWIIGVLILLFLVDFLLFFKDIMKTGKVKFGRIKAREKESFWVLLVAYLICLAIIVGEFIKFKPDVSYISYAGFGFIFLGGFIRIMARKELDKFFTFKVMIREGHKLIKTGPYRKLRHPTYLGSILIMLGLALCLSKVFGIIAVVIFFIPAILYRVGAEEKIMIKAFKNEYLAYMKTTKRLIPFIY